MKRLILFDPDLAFACGQKPNRKALLFIPSERYCKSFAATTTTGTGLLNGILL
jgi:hypothetical protein